MKHGKDIATELWSGKSKSFDVVIHLTFNWIAKFLLALALACFYPPHVMMLLNVKLYRTLNGSWAPGLSTI